MRLLFLAQKGRCFYCNTRLELHKNKRQKKRKRIHLLPGEEELYVQTGLVATRDHFKPESKGGDGGWRNSVFACPICNNKKGDLDPTVRHKDLKVDARCTQWREHHEQLIERVLALREVLKDRIEQVNAQLQERAEANTKRK